MNVERVRPRPSRFDRHLGLIAAFIAGALLAAIVKPWGSSDLSASVPHPTPSPRPSDTPTPELGFESRVYDPSIFGTHEPEATWAIWPAGFLVTFGFVIQVPGLSAPTSGTSPGASIGPSGTTASGGPGITDSSPPGGGTGDAVGDPIWPTRFDVPNGNHLLLIGINMPPGHSLKAVQLLHATASGSLVRVAIDQLPSPWPTHFAVIGIPTAPGDKRLAVWPPGGYRLDMSFNPGAVTRSIEISIAGDVSGP